MCVQNSCVFAINIGVEFSISCLLFDLTTKILYNWVVYFRFALEKAQKLCYNRLNGGKNEHTFKCI